MTILQLNPALPINTPKGEGLAHIVIDYGIEDHLFWVVFIKETGECWTFSNDKIRACKNITIGRIPEEKKLPDNIINPPNLSGGTPFVTLPYVPPAGYGNLTGGNLDVRSGIWCEYAIG